MLASEVMPEATKTTHTCTQGFTIVINLRQIDYSVLKHKKAAEDWSNKMAFLAYFS